MKKFLVILVVLPLMVLSAQDKESEQKTLFGGGKKVVITGFGAPELLGSQILGKEAGLFIGGKGGIIFNSSFVLGGAGYGLVTSHRFNYDMPVNNDNGEAYFKMGYGGLYLAYINSSDDLIHFTLSSLIGGGGAAYTNGGYRMHDTESGYMFENSGFFVFQPAVGVELNLFSFFRIEGTVGYRLALWSELSQHTDKDLSGIFGGLAFKFGKF